jgi:hypothetical protein
MTTELAASVEVTVDGIESVEGDSEDETSEQCYSFVVSRAKGTLKGIRNDFSAKDLQVKGE